MSFPVAASCNIRNPDAGRLIYPIDSALRPAGPTDPRCADDGDPPRPLPPAVIARADVHLRQLAASVYFHVTLYSRRSPYVERAAAVAVAAAQRFSCWRRQRHKLAVG